MKTNKKLGQHWLKNQGIIKKMIFHLNQNIKKNDTLVEIGGGTGALSRALFDIKNLTILEKDDGADKGL